MMYRFLAPLLSAQFRVEATQQPAVILFRRPPMPFTAMMYRFLAPLLSAQFRVEATQQPAVIFSLAIVPPRPRFISGRDWSDALVTCCRVCTPFPSRNGFLS